MVKNKRIIIASLVSPAAILLIPILGSIIVANTDPSILMDPMDDAPIKAAGLFLFALVPIVYPIFIVTGFTSTYLLKRLHLLSKKSLAILVVFSSIFFGVIIGFQNPFGIKDQIIGIGIFFSLFILCFGLGAMVWWLIAMPEHPIAGGPDGKKPGRET